MRDGRFAEIEEAGTATPDALELIDASGLIALPGVMDGHVHFRSPGLEHEEDWLTGTRAAVMGGVTTVLDMPNTLPPTDTVEHARQKLHLAAQSAYCDFGIFGLLGELEQAVRELTQSGLVMGLKAFLGPTTGGLSAPDDEGLLRALQITRAAGLRVAFHAEDAGIVQRAVDHATRADALAHLDSRPTRAEVRAIDRVGNLLSASMAAGHILHVSSADGFAAIESWRADGIHLTAEVTPHHLLLDLDAYGQFGGLAKVNPPIRGGPHRERLFAEFANGQIDVIGSDHAPHLEVDKRRDSIWDVPAGLAGVETLLPLLLTEVAEGRLTMGRLVEATSERPAHLWGLWPGKGAVKVGSDADLTLVDLERPGTIRAADLHGKNNATPFEGRPTRGAVVATIVRGRLVMRDGELLSPPGWGRPVSRS